VTKQNNEGEDYAVIKDAEFLVMTQDLSAVVRKAAWRIMPIIMTCYMFAFFDRIIISFAKFQLQADLALSDTAYGLGAGLFSVGYILFEVPSNIMLYKVGARRWLARIMISWGVATMIMMFVSTEWQFYAVRFVVGAAEAGFAPGVIYFLTLWFPAIYRGRVMSYMFLASACAGLLGGPMSGLILRFMDGVFGESGWHWLFIAGGAPCIFLGFVLLNRLDNQIADAKWLSQSEKDILSSSIAEEGKKTPSSHSLIDVLKAPGFLTLGLIYFLIQIGSYGLNFWTPHLIKMAGAQDPIVIGGLSAAPYICGALTMLVIGRLSDASGERRKYVALCLIAAAAGFASAAIFAEQPIALVLALSVTGAGIVSSVPAFWALPPKLVTGVGAAGGIALINTLGQFGGIVSPLMVGRISDATGSTNLALYVIAFLCVICVILIMRGLPEQLRRGDGNMNLPERERSTKEPQRRDLRAPERYLVSNGEAGD
jgi:MFS family permease